MKGGHWLKGESICLIKKTKRAEEEKAQPISGSKIRHVSKASQEAPRQ